jgi:hypothetical protein
MIDKAKDLNPIKPILSFADPCWDKPEVAESSYKQAVEAGNRNFFPPIIRKKPCSECAVGADNHGMYGDIVTACQKYLGLEKRQLIAKTWDCHNGGRCEGAAMHLLGEKQSTEVLS